MSLHPEYMMNETAMLCHIIPELYAIVQCEQRNPYHIYDVWYHTKAALLNEKSGSLIVRLALLFHDIGKPYCIQEDKNGIRHFKGHGRASANITQDVLKRMRFDNDTISKVVELIYYHDATIEDDKKYIKRWLNRIGEEQFRNLLLLRQCDIKAQNPLYETERLKKIEHISVKLTEVLKESECFQMKDLAINGHDLIACGIPEGKVIGSILKSLLDLVIEGDVQNDKGELFKAVNGLFAANPNLYNVTNKDKR